MKRALVIWFFVAALVAMGCSPPPDSFGSVATLADSDPGAIQLLGDYTDVGTIIASGVLSSSYQRQLARTSDGAWYSVYHRSDGTHTQVYLSRSTNEGQTWTEEQITTALLYHYDPAIAIDSNNNIHVAWIVFPDGDSAEQSYGYLWPGYPGYPGRVSLVQYRVRTSAWQSVEDVKTGYHTTLAIAVDSENSVHLIIGGHNPGGWNCAGINYAKRTVSGWSSIERVSSGCWTSAAAMAIDEANDVHVLYWHSPYSEPRCQIVYRQRTSSGWGSETELQSYDNYATDGLSIAVDASGDVHAVWGWHERGGDNYGIKYRRFTTYWEPTEDIVGPTNHFQTNPTIAVDGNDDIYVVWSGRHAGSLDLFQLRCREYTSAWQSIENLTSSTSHNQTNPNLMWASHPVVNGVKTNQPEEGYALIWMDGTTIRYWSATLIVEYELTIASTDGGSVTQPGEGTYTHEADTVVDLVATPAGGYRFVNWTGDVGTVDSVDSASTTIIMDGDYSIEASFEQEGVYFPDSNLETAIRQNIGKPTGDICQSDLEGLGSLWAEGRDISDLTGLEYAASLIEIDLRYNQISDILPLANLTNLVSLKLDGNQISDISPLTGLTNLEWLSLPVNEISDISPLANLTNLVSLKLDGNQISDILPLVDNLGLGAGDYLFLVDNHLNLTEGSQAMNDIQTLVDRRVTVSYEPQKQYGLTVSSTTGGTVTTPGEGTFTHYWGVVGNLVAEAEEGYRFVRWTGEVGTIVAVTSTTTTITMNDDYSITANFEPVAGVQTECVESATGTGEVCITTSHGFIEDLKAVPPHSLPSVLFPHGMFDFRITGLTPDQTVTLTIEFPSPLPIGTLWWKYDNGHWYGLPNKSDNGDHIMVISLTDGGVHDLDDVPGQITDPGGPGNPMTVGWEGSPISKAAVMMPWIGLLAAIAGASLLLLGRRRVLS